MAGMFRKGLISIIAIAMALTMFPLLGGSAYADGNYRDDEGYITVQVNGDRLDVVTDPYYDAYNADPNDDCDAEGDHGDSDRYLNMSGETPAWAGEASAVKTVFVGQGTRRIFEKSFADFTNLKTVFLPPSLYRIEEGAFANCDSIDTIYYGGTKEQWQELIGGTDPVIIKPENNDSLLTATVIYDKGYKDFRDAQITLSQKSFVWSNPHGNYLPDITKVNWNSKELDYKTDYGYEIEYSSNVGKRMVRCKGYNEYVGQRTVYYKVNPKGTSIKKLKRAKKAVTVTWAKQAKKMARNRITGYQIQLATNKKFTKNKKLVTVKGYKKTSKKIKKLKKKKKYYVRIRTYMKVNGMTNYSGWSKVKSIRTK